MRFGPLLLLKVQRERSSMMAFYKGLFFLVRGFDLGLIWICLGDGLGIWASISLVGRWKVADCGGLKLLLGLYGLFLAAIRDEVWAITAG